MVGGGVVGKGGKVGDELGVGGGKAGRQCGARAAVAALQATCVGSVPRMYLLLWGPSSAIKVFDSSHRVYDQVQTSAEPSQPSFSGQSSPLADS